MGRGSDSKAAALHPQHQQHLRTKQRLPLWLLPLLAISCFGLLGVWVWWFQAALPPSNHRLLPSSLEELGDSADYIALVAKQRPWTLALTFAFAYLLKQTFSVPGSVALNVFAGVAFGQVKGVLLTAFLTALGASLAFCLSMEFGHHVIHRWRALETRILPLKLRIGAARKRKTLIFYLCALRMTSFFPQWLLNLASPHLAVPLVTYFFPATLIGTLPYNAVTVSAGAALADALLHRDTEVGIDIDIDGGAGQGGLRRRPPLELKDIFGYKAFFLMLALAVVVALPGLLMKKMEARMGLAAADEEAKSSAANTSAANSTATATAHQAIATAVPSASGNALLSSPTLSKLESGPVSTKSTASN